MSEITQLKNLLWESAKRNPYKNLLFSGGLDTSVLATLQQGLRGITISFGADSEDIPYARRLARLLNIQHIHRQVDVEEAIEAIPQVIKMLQSFDPAIPNDLPVYFGLKKAQELGINEIATGDASDELFGGYSFMQNLEDLDTYTQRISQNLQFNSNRLGEYLGIKIIQPFVTREIMDFALGIPRDLKIKEEEGKFTGKWLLRKAFEDVLPQDIVWQGKRPLEYGSGFNRMREIIADRVSAEEFEQRPVSMKFISREHFYYYKVYREVVGEIPQPEKGHVPCPGCGTGMKKNAFHCRICGYVLESNICNGGGDRK